MAWMNSRKGSWTCFAGITFAIIVLFSISSCSVPASTKPLAPTDTPVPAPTDIPTITSPPTATDTPTQSYPEPTLVNPVPGATIMGEKMTNFSWQWDGALQEGEKFDLRIWRSEEPCCSIAILDEDNAMWDEDKKCSYLLDTPPGGFGHYLWQVAVVRIGESDKSILSESQVWSFVWSDVTPTLTPTATPTPIPTPDAVVNVEALNLRSGPGTVYDKSGALEQGDPLEITGRNAAGDWVEVVCPGGKKGWVAASCLEINIPLAGVAVAQAPPTPTPMYTPTPTVTPTPKLLPPPILTEPENGASFAGWRTFRWQWTYPLEADEYFSFRVHNEKEGECHRTQVRDLAYTDGFTFCPSGEYYWGVTLVRKLCEICPEEQKWQPLSQLSEERLIHYQVVDKPEDEPRPPPPSPPENPTPVD